MLVDVPVDGWRCDSCMFMQKRERNGREWE